MSDVKAAKLKPEVVPQPHQSRLWEEAAGKDFRKLLLHALGSGKSVSALGLAEQAGGPYTAIVPASLRETWKRERQRFTTGETPSDIISYTAAAKQLPVDKLQTLILDEAHRLRTPGTKQTIAVAELAKKAPNVAMLTGTPIINAPESFAPLMSILTQKPISPAEFSERYVETKPVYPNIFRRLLGVTPGEEQVVARPEEFKSLLKGHIDYYSPPKPTVPVNYEDVDVEMSVPQSRLYRAMWDQLPWLLRWKLKHDFPLSREELMRTRAFMVGPRQVGLSTLPYLRTPDPYKAYQQSSKLQKAHELLQDKLKDPRAKALIFSNFVTAGLKPYSAALDQANVPHAIFHGGLSDEERRKLVSDFNSGRIRVALLGPSGSEGLSFKGTQLIQILDPYWHGIRSRQSEGRGIRFDSHADLPPELQNVTIQRFIAKLPLGFKDRILARLGFDRSTQQRAADDYLRTMSDRKDQVNKQFLDILKEIGTPKTAQDESDKAWTVEHPYLFAGGAAAAVVAAIALNRLLRKAGLKDLDERVDSRDSYWANDPLAPVKRVRQWTPIEMERTWRKRSGAVLDELRQAKQHSDVGNYKAKHAIIRRMMETKPHHWRIDQDDGGSIVGVSHVTGWRFHLPRRVVPAVIKPSQIE